MILALLIILPAVLALTCYIIGQRSVALRKLIYNFTLFAELALSVVLLIDVLSNGKAEVFLPKICSMGVGFEADGFRAIYVLIAAFMWAMTGLFSNEYFDGHHNLNRYFMFNLFTLSATAGLFLSSDLFTALIFLELLSFTSYVWVVQEESNEALNAGDTYLAVSVIGGMVSLLGLFLLYTQLGTLKIAELSSAAASYGGSKASLLVSGILTAVGFFAKAGVYPLHIWLPKAHPVAPAPASALLSGILTKAGVFGTAVLTAQIFVGDKKWGYVILTLGVITMVLGALLALISVDLKRTLACSSMSQIGFITVGIAMTALLDADNTLAARGVSLHMVNHSLIKLVLFMIAGVVFMNLHKLNLNDIRGAGKKNPLLMICFLIGGLSISGVPFFSGYLSKTLIHESIVEYYAMNPSLAIKAAEWLFIISGGLTFAYMTKLFVCLFIENGEGVKPVSLNKLSKFAIGISSAVLFALGIFPNFFADGIADRMQGFFSAYAENVTVDCFSFENLRGALISLVIGALAYMFAVRKILMKTSSRGTEYVDYTSKCFDLDTMLYRPLINIIVGIIGMALNLANSLVDTVSALVRMSALKSLPLSSPKKHSKFSQWRKSMSKENMILSSSLSYGLVACGFGIILMLIFLLARA